MSQPRKAELGSSHFIEAVNRPVYLPAFQQNCHSRLLAANTTLRKGLGEDYQGLVFVAHPVY